MTQAPLTSYHAPQNFCQVFPSKDTTRGKKASSFTQQHPECYHQSTNKQTSQLLYYASPKIAQNDCKRRKAQATSQWWRRWSTNTPFLLHEWNLSTTITCHFLRLSIVGIFPMATDQAKKVALKGTLVCQILFQGKGVSSLQARTL